MSGAPTPKPSVWRFALKQWGLLLAHGARALGGGIILGLWRRQLHGRALLTALCLMLAPQGLLLMGTQGTRPSQSLLWGLSLGASLAAGMVAARISRRMAMWELYAAVLLGGAITYALLRSPPQGTGEGPGRAVAFGQPEPLGALLLGPLWDHLFALWMLLMLMAAAVGASLAVLFFGMGEGRTSRSREFGARLEWRLAVRHLAGSRTQAVSTTAWVTVLGVALGVASLIVVTAVMSGYQHDIESKILSTNAHLVLQKYGIDFAEHNAIVQAAEATPGIEAAAPFAFNEAMLSVNGRGLGVLLKGIDPKRSARVTGSARNLCLPGANTGEPSDHPLSVISQSSRCSTAGAKGPELLNALLAPNLHGQVPNVIVGLSLYRKLGVPLGTQVHLMTPVGMAGSRGGAPKRMAFTLAGVFASGMHEFDAHLVYVGLPAAQTLLGLGQSVSGVEMRLKDPSSVGHISEQLLNTVGHYPYRTLDWRELNASIFMALSLQKVVMFLVLTFIVVVAAFNIASTLFMAVVEKGAQIAVLLSLGATRSTVMKIFVIEGWLTGVAGTALGTVLGLLVAQALSSMRVAIASDVYMVDALTLRLAPHEVAVTLAAALVICHLATLYPALRATQARPIDLLRHG